MSKTCSTKFTWSDRSYPILTWTSAMDAWSWSLPAGVTCPGAVSKSPDHICYGCYAQLGCYNYPTTLNAQAARLAWVKECMQTAAGRQHWIDVMTTAIRKHCHNGYFRWHDSGDVFNVEYGKMIFQVIANTTEIRHWIPTRSWRLKRFERILQAMNELPQVVVRPSALKFGDTPPEIAGLSPGSTAHKNKDSIPAGARECPKASKDNDFKSCEQASCRLCWEDSEGASYLVHGRRGSTFVHKATEKETANRREACKRQVELGQ